MREEVAALEARRAEARAMGGEKRIARQHERGKLDVRERVALLVDDDTFLEFGLHASEYDDPLLPADGAPTTAFDEARREGLAHPLIGGQLLSTDGRTTLVIARMAGLLRPAPPDREVLQSEAFDRVGFVKIAAIEYNGVAELFFQQLKVRAPEFLPFRNDDEGIGAFERTVCCVAQVKAVLVGV